MKILLIHHRIPYPITSGMDKVRYNLIRTLSRVHEVTLVAPVDEYTSPEALEHVRGLCHELVGVPVRNRILQIQRSKALYLWRFLSLVLLKIPAYITETEYSQMHQMVNQLIESGNFDLVQALSDMTTGYAAQANSQLFKILGPLDDSVESARTKLQVAPNWRKRIVWWMEHRARRAYQPGVCKRGDRVFFFSDDDLARIADLAGGLPQARVLPVAVEAYDPPLQEIQEAASRVEPHSLVFVGGMGSLFNQDAALYFCREILPMIQQSLPDITLYIVGQNPPSHIKRLEQIGRVFVTGNVLEVRPYIEQAAVYIAPVRAGTGLKTKMIEALSLGKAIVATSSALQGLWDLGEDVIQVRDKAEDFASEVIALLRDDGRRIELGRRARELYDRSYTFDVVAPRTLAVYNEIERLLYSGKFAVRDRNIPAQER